MKSKTIILLTAIVATSAIAKPAIMPDGAIRGIGHVPFHKLPLDALLVVTEFIPHVSPNPDDQIIYGTDANDIIDITDDIYYELALVDPLEGNDVVYINRYQNVFAVPGNDVIIGVINNEEDAPGYGAWNSPTPVNVNLAAGTAEDGFGYNDTLTNISVVHLWGGTVIGSSADENVFAFSGGNKSLHMAGGRDTITYWEKSDSDVSIQVVGTTVYVTDIDGSVDTITGAEVLSFDNITYDIVYP